MSHQHVPARHNDESPARTGQTTMSHRQALTDITMSHQHALTDITTNHQHALTRHNNDSSPRTGQTMSHQHAPARHNDESPARTGQATMSHQHAPARHNCFNSKHRPDNEESSSTRTGRT
jgi:hypothetical protein